MQPYGLAELQREFTAFSPFVVLYLPRTSDLKQLAKTVKGEERAVVMHYCMDGASKALCLYSGGFSWDEYDS